MTYDHELKIGSETKRLSLAQREDGTKYYSVIEETPQYRNPLRFIQENWIGGHGQVDFRIPDKYFEGQSIDTTVDGKVILGPEIIEVKENDASNIEAPVAFAWYPAVSNLYCATGTKVYVFDATNVNLVAMNASPANISDLKIHNLVMYAARSNVGAYQWSSNGTDFQATDLVANTFNKFMTSPNAAGTATVLWGSTNPNQLRSTTDGQSVANGGSAWTSPAYIGDTADNINNLFLVNDKLMVGKSDGLWHYDSDGGTHQLMSDLRISRSTDNFKYITDWQAGVYFSLLRSMGEITSYNSYEPMGPLYGIDDIGKVGDIVGVTADKDNLFIAVDEGTNTIIYKGRERRTPDGLRWEFCPFVFLGTKACATISIVQHSSTDRRLWFGYGVNAAFVRLSDNPTADTNYRFCANGWARMSYDLGTNLYWDKLYQSIITQTINCVANQDVIVSARKDTETTANAITNAIISNGMTMTNLISPINCNRVQFQLNLRTATNTKTPEVSYFEARGTERPETIRIHEAVYLLGDEPTRRTETIRTFLRGGRTSKTLIKFADLRYGDKTAGTSSGDYVWTVMEPGYPQEIELTHTKSKQPEMGVKVRLREVNYTIS